jgi:subtilisin family serine protease
MIVVVASSDMLGQLSSYSAFGKDVVSLAAPGELILVFNTEAENEYCYDSGTSFAASHVTGALVLLLSAFPHCTVLRTYMHTLHGSVFRFHIYLKRIISNE